MLVCKNYYYHSLLLAAAACLRRTSRIRYFRGVADAGVMKYNGKYYIGGVRTNGDFYVSDDLVHWGETYPCRIHGQ